MLRIALPGIVLLLCIGPSVAPAGAAAPRAVFEDAPEFIEDLPEQPPPYSTYTNLLEQLDWLHDWTFLSVQRRVKQLDDLFIDEEAGEVDLPEEVARFIVGTFGKYQEDNGAKWTFEPDVDVSIHLPNLQQRFELFITTEQLDDLLGTDPTERENDLRIGIDRQIGRWLPSAGVKLSTSPEVFVSTSIGRTLRWGHYYFSPGQRFFWESDDRFGTVPSLTIDRWVDRLLLRSSTSARWTERTNGVEWEQSLVVGYAWAVLARARRGHLSGPQDMALGVGARASVFGQKSGTGIVDRYRVSTFFKFPLIRPYLFGLLSPELQYRNKNDWKDDWAVKFGLEAVFWDLAL